VGSASNQAQSLGAGLRIDGVGGLQFGPIPSVPSARSGDYGNFALFSYFEDAPLGVVVVTVNRCRSAAEGRQSQLMVRPVNL